MSSIDINWVVEHEPLHLFLRTAENFKTKISELSNDRINVNIIVKTPETDYIKADMRQLTTTVLGQYYSDFSVFDLPFLFKDHDHVSRVVDGKVGMSLLNQLGKVSKFQGLAFTYSGGFRTMVSKKPIKSLKDLENLTFSCQNSEIIADTYKILGVNPVQYKTDSDADLKKAILESPNIDFDGGETTLVRYDTVKDFAPYITDTGHSIFMTTILIKKEFFEKLSEEDKNLLFSAAKYAAKKERENTIQDTEQFKKNANQHCKGMFEFDENELENFKNKTKKLYEKEYLNSHFSPNLAKQVFNS